MTRTRFGLENTRKTEWLRSATKHDPTHVTEIPVARESPGSMDEVEMATDRDWRQKALDSFLDDRLADADAVQTTLALPDTVYGIDSDLEVLAAAEQDPEQIGHALASYRKRQGWTHDDLASFLGLTLRQLTALSVEHRPRIRSKQGNWSRGAGSTPWPNRTGPTATASSRPSRTGPLTR